MFPPVGDRACYPCDVAHWLPVPIIPPPRTPSGQLNLNLTRAPVTRESHPMQTPLGSFLRVVALQVSIHDVPRLRTRQRVRGSLEQTPPVSPGRRQRKCRRNQLIIKKHRRRHRVKIPTIQCLALHQKKKRNIGGTTVHNRMNIPYRYIVKAFPSWTQSAQGCLTSPNRTRSDRSPLKWLKQDGTTGDRGRVGGSGPYCWPAFPCKSSRAVASPSYKVKVNICGSGRWSPRTRLQKSQEQGLEPVP